MPLNQQTTYVGTKHHYSNQMSAKSQWGTHRNPQCK